MKTDDLLRRLDAGEDAMALLHESRQRLREAQAEKARHQREIRRVVDEAKYGRHRGADDDVILEAIQLLREINVRVDPRYVIVEPLLAKHHCYGMCWGEPRRISIGSDTPIYRWACESESLPDLKALAGAIAHEEYHRLHGPDEPPAYRTHIDVLKRLDAEPEAIALVERTARANKIDL